MQLYIRKAQQARASILLSATDFIYELPTSEQIQPVENLTSKGFYCVSVLDSTGICVNIGISCHSSELCFIVSLNEHIIWEFTDDWCLQQMTVSSGPDLNVVAGLCRYKFLFHRQEFACLNSHFAKLWRSDSLHKIAGDERRPLLSAWHTV